MASKSRVAESDSFFTDIFKEASVKDKTGEFITFQNQSDVPTYLDPNYFFRSGLTLVDIMLGYGGKTGFGSGRMVELFGQNKTGKSALATEFANQALMDHANAQVLYIDMERALTKERVKAYPMYESGRFGIACPTNLNEAFSLMKKVLARSLSEGKPVLAIFDSVAAMRAKAELEREEGKAVISAQARIFSEELPAVRGMLSKSNGLLLMLNQLRDKPNSMSMPGQPAPDHTPGGKSIQFYADYRVKTVAIGKYSLAGGKVVKSGQAASGFQSCIKVIKNKSGIPERQVVVPLIYFPSQGNRSGLSECWSIFETLKATDMNLIKTKSGGQYTIDGSTWFKRVEWAAYLKSLRTEDGSYKDPLRSALETWRERLLEERYGNQDSDDDLDGHASDDSESDD